MLVGYTVYIARLKACSQQINWTELACTKLTQLHDASGIGHVRQRHEVDWLQFANCSYDTIRYEMLFQRALEKRHESA